MNVSNLKLLLTALVLSVGLYAPAAWARQESGERNARVVIAVGAVDKEGRSVEGLKAEDLRVTVEGQPLQPISFDRRTQEPLHLVLLLDASASQERVLRQIGPPAATFVSELLRAGRDDAAVVSFTDEARIVQGLTGDAAALRRAILSVKFNPPPGYVAPGIIVYGKPPRKNDPAMRATMTGIWDSLVAICDRGFAGARGGRRAVLLLTDGEDTTSVIKRDAAIERLTREGVAVYSVGVADPYSFDPVSEGGLREVSKQTGGRALFPKPGSPEELVVAFEKLRRELLAAYTLTLAAPPSADGKALKLRVEVVNPALRKQGVQLAYPQTLFPPAATR